MAKEEIVNGIGGLAKSLCLAQKAFKPLKKSADNPYFKSKYADLCACIDATRDALTSNGLALTQRVDTTSTNQQVLISELIHVSGEKISSTFLIPEVKDIQKLGSAITYARRYSLMALVGLAAEDEDDDGNLASHTYRNVATLQQKAASESVKQSALLMKEYINNNLAMKNVNASDLTPLDRLEALKELESQQKKLKKELIELESQPNVVQPSATDALIKLARDAATEFKWTKFQASTLIQEAFKKDKLTELTVDELKELIPMLKEGPGKE